MTLLAIDPGRSYKGEKTIGISLWGTNGPGDWREITRESVTFEHLVAMLDLQAIDDYSYVSDEDLDKSFWLSYGIYTLSEVVVEDFVNNTQSKGGQRNGTSECIGAVEYACLKGNVPFSRQEPAALGPAKLHAPEGSWKPLKHLRHEDSAFLHGYEYLVRKGVLQSAGLAATMSADQPEQES